MEELISIVLPVYNGERYLSSSIESVINQTYSNWELLILDDCSTDRTAEIAEEYQKRDARIHYYRNEQNLRLPANLNKGFSLARGQYLTWTSDDNEFCPEALERMHSVLKKQPKVQLVYASYQVIDEDGKDIQAFNARRGLYGEILYSNNVGACFMYTRKVYEEIGDYDTSLMLVEDMDYWQRVCARYSVETINEILYKYRWHENSLTSTKKLGQYGSVMEQMLVKNRPAYGKLNVEVEYFYYKKLSQALEWQNKANPYILKCAVLKTGYLFTRMSRKLQGVFHKHA